MPEKGQKSEVKIMQSYVVCMSKNRFEEGREID